jgi:hypothetical protein
MKLRRHLWNHLHATLQLLFYTLNLKTLNFQESVPIFCIVLRLSWYIKQNFFERFEEKKSFFFLHSTLVEEKVCINATNKYLGTKEKHVQKQYMSTKDFELVQRHIACKLSSKLFWQVFEICWLKLSRQFSQLAYPI